MNLYELEYEEENEKQLIFDLIIILKTVSCFNTVSTNYH